MRILLAGDDAGPRKALESKLREWGYEVVVAGDGLAALAALQKQDAPKLAILDSAIAGMDARQVCREVRKRVEEPYIYVFLLADPTAQADLLSGIEAGADDYLTKPVNPDEFQVRLRAGRRILELKDELRLAHEAVGFQVTHDPLTGLMNRAAIVDLLRRELARVRREGTLIGIILVELDNLKSINETYGSLAGDAVLREVARRIRSSVRPYDSIGRYSGEEFLMVVPGCDAENALSQAERFRVNFAAAPVDVTEWGKQFGPQQRQVKFTLSGGVASSATANEAEAVLRGAEAALARAKKAGRNRVELAAIDELK